MVEKKQPVQSRQTEGTNNVTPNGVQVQVFKTEPQQPMAAVETTHLARCQQREINQNLGRVIASATTPEPTTPDQAVQTPVSPNSVTVSNDRVAELTKASKPSAPSLEQPLPSWQ